MTIGAATIGAATIGAPTGAPTGADIICYGYIIGYCIMGYCYIMG